MTLSCLNLVIKIPRIPLVILVAAVLSRGLLPLSVVSHVMLKDTGESDSRQHAHHRSQCQHQTHHHTGEIDCADGIQGHWKAEGEKTKQIKVRQRGGWRECKETGNEPER